MKRIIQMKKSLILSAFRSQGFIAAIALLAGSVLTAMAGGSGRAGQTQAIAPVKEQTAAPAVLDARRPTLFLIGDSTVKNHTKGLMGWGDPLANWFDKTKINVENDALGGRSSRTFLMEGLWDKVLAKLKAGDFVLMQFGHNDGGSVAKSYRASLKGGGEETEDVTDAKTGRKETVHTYGWYLRKYVMEAKGKGATPILLSPVPRNIWKDDHTVARASGDYGKWAMEAAKAQNVAFIDLNNIIARRYEALGPDKVKAAYFPGDHTHTSPEGAELNAASVVEGLRALKECPLAAYLLDKPAPAAPIAAPENRPHKATCHLWNLNSDSER